MPVVGTEPRATARQRSSPSSLPVELSSFVGRSVELAEVKRLLQAAHAITLTGPGGIGKTRLAVRAAGKLARHFPDGVRFVELAELSPRWSSSRESSRCCSPSKAPRSSC